MSNFKHYLLFSLAAIMTVDVIHASQMVEATESHQVKLDQREPDEKLNAVIIDCTELGRDFGNLIGDYMGYSEWGPIKKITLSCKDRVYSSDDMYGLHILTNNRIVFSHITATCDHLYDPHYYRTDIFDDHSGSAPATLWGNRNMPEYYKEFHEEPKGELIRSSEDMRSINKSNQFIVVLRPLGKILIECKPQSSDDFSKPNPVSYKKRPIQNIYFVHTTGERHVKLALPSCDQPINYLSCVAKDDDTFVMLIRDRHKILHMVTYSKCSKIDYLDQQNEPHRLQNDYMRCLLAKALYIPHLLAAGSAGLGLLSAYRWYRGYTSPRELCLTAGGALAAGLTALTFYRNR